MLNLLWKRLDRVTPCTVAAKIDDSFYSSEGVVDSIAEGQGERILAREFE
jgi:hypothetical protein